MKVLNFQLREARMPECIQWHRADSHAMEWLRKMTRTDTVFMQKDKSSGGCSSAGRYAYLGII